MNRRRFECNVYGEIIGEHNVDAKPQLPPKNAEAQRALFKAYIQQIIVEHVEPLIELLKMRFPEYKWEIFQHTKEEPNNDYMDDGNTQCPGTKYHHYIMIPINREMRFHYLDNPLWYEVNDIYHGTSQEMIYFSIDKQYRDHDNRTRNSDYNALCVATFNFDRLNQKSERIFYSPNGLSINSILLVKLIGLVEKTLKDQATFNWLKSIDPKEHSQYFNKMVGNTD